MVPLTWPGEFCRDDSLVVSCTAYRQLDFHMSRFDVTTAAFIQHPYRDLDDRAFWSRSVAIGAEMVLPELFRPKFQLERRDQIATAGSCFAQHIGRYLTRMGLRMIDLEPPPPGIASDIAEAHGYGLYSARYGNIYTTRQLRRLIEEATGDRTVPLEMICWERGGRWWDALRPNVEPQGWESPEEIAWHRQYHIKRVSQVLSEMDVFIFTLGLTECWTSVDESLAYPLAPGVIAGSFHTQRYKFHQLSQSEVIQDFLAVMEVLKRWRSGRPLRVLLTVSPVPLAATYSDCHVLAATMASKATLLSAAVELARSNPLIEYFPSFEIVANPWLSRNSFASDKRSVTPKAIERVMQVWAESFNLEILPPSPNALNDRSKIADRDAQCEEFLTDIFSRRL